MNDSPIVHLLKFRLQKLANRRPCARLGKYWVYNDAPASLHHIGVRKLRNNLVNGCFEHLIAPVSNSGDGRAHLGVHVNPNALSMPTIGTGIIDTNPAEPGMHTAG